MNEYAHYDGKAHKLLSDNRAAYFAQSARTVKHVTNGRAADFAEQYAQEQALDALIPSTDDWRA